MIWMLGYAAGSAIYLTVRILQETKLSDLPLLNLLWLVFEALAWPMPTIITALVANPVVFRKRESR